MDCSVHTSLEELERLGPHWEALNRRARGTVFQSYVWAIEWWRVFHQDHELFVISAHDGDTLVGLFPAFKQKLRIGPLSFTRLRFLGEGTTFGEFQPLTLPECEDELYAQAASLCATELAHHRCDAIDFQHVRRDSAFSSMFPSALRTQHVSVRTGRTPLSRILLELPGTWESYLQGLSLRQRRLLKRQSRILREQGITLQVTDRHTEFPSVFEHLVRLHESVWTERDRPGRFAGMQGFERFLRFVVPALMAEGQARIYSLLAGGTYLASLLVFLSPGSACAYVLGRDPHHPLSKYSPGTVLFGMCIQDAIREGCLLFDFLGGEQPYKVRLGGRSTSYARILACAPGTKGLKALAAYAAGPIARTLQRFYA
jgi:CelD/BcsL family acetyltransferase involved in cellulose biosynthesis